MNKIFVVGNLTHDPEQRTTPNGISVCQFSVACNRRQSSSAQGEDRQTDYFRVTAWRQLGDVCSKYLARGRKVAVSGTLQLRQYVDKNGQNRTSAEINADDVEFLSPRGEGGPARQSSAAAAPTYSADSFDDTTGFTELDESTLPF